MVYRPVSDALDQARTMFYGPAGTGATITQAARASTPPLGMAPSTAAPGIGGGSATPVDTSQRILSPGNPAWGGFSTYNQYIGNKVFGLGSPGAAAGTSSAWEPPGRGGNAGANRGGAPSVGAGEGRTSGTPGGPADEGGPGGRRPIGQ